MLRFSWVWLLHAVFFVAVPCLAQESRTKDPPAQEGAKKDPLPVVPAGVTFCPDLTYCKLKGRALDLDLAYPAAGKGPFPAVVFFHGSGLGSQGRKFNLPQVFELAQKGYVAVTVSYRHLPSEPFPGAIHDAKCAIRWLRAHAEKYQLDPERIGAVGFSGGGTLALLLALAPANKDLEGDGGHANQSSRLQAVVSYFAPTDLKELSLRKAPGVWGAIKATYVRESLTTWLGGPADKVPDRYSKASPLTYARKGAPPIQFFHGGADDVVPVEQSIALSKKIGELGGYAELLIFQNAPHDFDAIDNLVTRTARYSSHDFFDVHLRAKKARGQK
jgi:acetyl esterase/lipase